MNILVVEDNRDIAENIADYLEPRGHSLDFAADGRLGLQLALDHDFDVIVLDLMLPGLPGLELLRQQTHSRRTSMPDAMLLSCVRAIRFSTAPSCISSSASPVATKRKSCPACPLSWRRVLPPDGLCRRETTC